MTSLILNCALSNIHILMRLFIWSKIWVMHVYLGNLISPAEFDQLVFMFDGSFSFDKVMPFGCSISCASWEKVSTFLESVAKHQSLFEDLNHYVDDFLFAGKAGTNNCLIIMKNFFFCCDQMGFPIASLKTVWPTTHII